jgi:hypothetical protein
VKISDEERLLLFLRIFLSFWNAHVLRRQSLKSGVGKNIKIGTKHNIMCFLVPLRVII